MHGRRSRLLWKEAPPICNHLFSSLRAQSPLGGWPGERSIPALHGCYLFHAPSHAGWLAGKHATIKFGGQRLNRCRVRPLSCRRRRMPAWYVSLIPARTDADLRACCMKRHGFMGKVRQSKSKNLPHVALSASVAGGNPRNRWTIAECTTTTTIPFQYREMKRYFCLQAANSQDFQTDCAVQPITLVVK